METEVMQRIFDPFEQGNRSFEHRVSADSASVWRSQNLSRRPMVARLLHKVTELNRGSTFTLSMQALAQSWSS